MNTLDRNTSTALHHAAYASKLAEPERQRFVDNLRPDLRDAVQALLGMPTPTNLTALTIANAALLAVFDDPSEESTGFPSYQGRPLGPDAGLAGKVPSHITWTTDRGNWMWDGVCATLRCMGVDTDQPL